MQILSNHRIKWHILLPHVANQFLRHLSCLSRLPRSRLGTGLQCLGEVHLVRDHVASAEGIKANWHISFLNTWIVSGILPGFASKTTTTFWGNSNRQWMAAMKFAKNDQQEKSREVRYNRQPSFENNIFVNLKTSPDVYGVKLKQINRELVKSALIPDSSIFKENTRQPQRQKRRSK